MGLSPPLKSSVYQKCKLSIFKIGEKVLCLHQSRNEAAKSKKVNEKENKTDFEIGLYLLNKSEEKDFEFQY
ncbi:hypothetical protein BpHYR1_001542 [Brachionus plicatilis]|uniref:Uncharacterized protein n=1 Tax=Brachionus plicatilis TaxID=10195 RepID=A0A3M7Q0M8_BRAPC|nr:hypothetical protein BpHYR1_001542 [Brachionus plicatilis]